jgi:hypothetical protein
MKFLKIFSGKPLKRAEIKIHSDDSKLRVRASRTGGVNAAFHPLRGLTFNTKYGVRASKTFKGLTLGFQGGNTVVRGRWSTKNQLFNLNLSKSGFSLSSKNDYGTFNFTNPNRSSFKFGGVQLRGQKAAGPALFFTTLTLSGHLIVFIFDVIIFLLKASLFVIKLIIAFIPVLIDLGYLTSNIILFFSIDLPKQLYNNFSKSNLFHPDIDGLIECSRMQEESKIIKKEIHDEIECESNSLKKAKLTKIEISLERRIEKIDKKLNQLRKEREEEIILEENNLKEAIANLSHYEDISRYKLIGYYLMALIGSALLLPLILIAIVVIFDPSLIIPDDVTSMIFLSLFFSLSGTLMLRPVRKLLKLKDLKRNLIALQ